jgi:transcriptional regulator with PAS, ATPase and Fis domain
VLLEGETGTGKELIAQAIHSASARSAAPFVAVNCASLPKELATAEFFGFESGSFTGAAKDGRIGKFEQADRGTMFLDEIGDMPLELQGLLLRVLEECEVVRVGGRKTISVDVRIIAASNQALLSSVKQGSFRRDLYYRLNVVRIEMPPLRSRGEDLELLLDHFMERASIHARRTRPRIEAAARRVLEDYSWPGNIRELRNVAERLVVVGADVIKETDLPPELFTTAVPPNDVQASDGANTALKAQEMTLIRSVLEQCGGNIAQAARILGINRSTIYRKLGRSPSSR